MRVTRRGWGLLALGVALGLGAPALGQETPAAASGDAAAIVAGTPIDMQAVDELIRGQLMELRAREYQLRSQALDALVTHALIEREARARGITPEALHKAEVEDRAQVSDAEAKAFYAANKERFQSLGESEALEQIRAGLGRQRTSERLTAFGRELREKYPVQVLLEPYRIPVETAGAPARGNPNAPVTVVEFTDFQCPFCMRARPVVARVRETYGDKVRWVFRHFPLDFHAQAEKAGEAAVCAGDQGKFWAMHDALFSSAGKLQVADLKATARAVGLDGAAFDQCLDSGGRSAVVESDVELGRSYGVSGTPAFFVNGRMLVGAQPFEAFQKIIDDELRRVAVASAPATR
jgi:predicted DsbA family dithiol-disulfide isomerase